MPRAMFWIRAPRRRCFRPDFRELVPEIDRGCCQDKRTHGGEHDNRRGPTGHQTAAIDYIADTHESHARPAKRKGGVRQLTLDKTFWESAGGDDSCFRRFICKTVTPDIHR